jgi:hypothetical protein
MLTRLGRFLPEHVRTVFGGLVMAQAAIRAPTKAQSLWVEAVLGIDPSTVNKTADLSDAGPPASTTTNANLKTALDVWASGREAATKQMETLIAAISSYDHPRSKQAVALIKDAITKLPDRPDTADAVDDLLSYITTDSIICSLEQPNGFGLAITARARLLTAIGPVADALHVRR